MPSWGLPLSKEQEYESLSDEEKAYMRAFSKLGASPHKNVPEDQVLSKVLPCNRGVPKKVFRGLEKKGYIFNYGARSGVWGLTMPGLHMSKYIRERIIEEVGMKVRKHG